MTPQLIAPLELFYSYSHKDEELRDQLEEHLSMLKRETVISGWHDRRISGGREWDGQIDDHLNSADIILLLTSSTFLASDYCYDLEVKRAMERHEAGNARVIPVILRACDWHSAPFGKLQALPKDAKPVKQWPDPDNAFLDIAKGIRRVAEEMRALRNANQETPAEPNKPDPYLYIPELRVRFVRRKDSSGDDIVKLLQDELSTERARLVALWGGGGVGKTAIAAETVRGIIDRFRRRIAWVSADGLENFSLATLLDEIATQLGDPDLRKLPLDLKKEQVRDLVRTAPTLVVLDNFETIDPLERTHCVDWLSKPVPCSALITTRDKIEEARDIPIDVMRPEEANALLDQLIAQTHDARAFVKLDRDRLIQTAEANPLVLQWIVGQIDLAQDPDEVLEDLRHGEGTAAERVFNRSFELKQLNNGGRAVLLALSLFAPSATRKAVAEVSGFGKESDKKKFRDAVKSLSALWLIHTTDESKRLAVEGLTRQLTKARLDTDPRAKTFHPRFVSRFLRYAQTHARSTREDYNALEVEKDNLLSAMDIAFEARDWHSVLGLMNAINLDGVSGMLSVRGYWQEVIHRGQQALEAAHALHHDSGIAAITHNLALIYHQSGSLEEARRLYDDSLNMKRRLGDQSGTAGTLHQLATLAHDRGEIEEARRLYEESLAIEKKSGNQSGIASTLHQLATLAHDRGEIEEARRLYEESLALKNGLRNQGGIAISLQALGTLSHAQGEFDEARRFYDESLQISGKLGNQNSIAVGLQSLGRLSHDLGELDEAWRLHNESLQINKKLGNQSGIAASLQNLGGLSRDRGDLDEARRRYNESLQINMNLGNQRGVADSLLALGRLTQDQGAFDAARRLYDESLGIRQKLGDQSGIASALHQLATLAQELGRIEEARRLYDESLTIERKLGNRIGIACGLHQLGTLSFDEGNYETTERLLLDSLVILKDLADKQNCSECLESIGKLRVRQGHLAEARPLFDEALKIADQLRTAFRIASVKHSLGLLAEKQDEKVRAVDLIREALKIFEKLCSPRKEDARRDLERVEGK